MKKALIITLGTRDVQIDPKAVQDAGRIIESTAPDGKKMLHFHAAAGEQGLIEVFRDKDVHTFIPALPRTAGEVLQQHFEEFQPYLLFPMVEKLLQTLALQATDTWDVLIVVTDQLTGKYSNRDTCHMAPLVQQWMSIQYPDVAWDFDTYTITEEVVNLDYQYSLFEQEAGELLDDSKAYEEVVFFPQGGIDQINQALTLRLIELFRDKLSLYQVQEGHEQAVRRTFPEMFLRNLVRHQHIKLAEHFEFSILKDQAINDKVRYLASWGEVLMSCNQGLIAEKWVKSRNRLLIDFPELEEEISAVIPENATKNLRLFYLTAKIKYQNGQIDDSLWRLWTLNEQMLKPFTEEVLKSGIPLEEAPYTGFNQLIADNSFVINWLNNQNVNKTKNEWERFSYYVPNLKLYEAIYKEYVKVAPEKQDIKLNRIKSLIKELRNSRNNLVHQMYGVNEKLLDTELNGKLKYADVYKELDEYYNITDLGIFSRLKQELEALLNPK